jgi:hypothetical protein
VSNNLVFDGQPNKLFLTAGFHIFWVVSDDKNNQKSWCEVQNLFLTVFFRYERTKNCFSNFIAKKRVRQGQSLQYQHFKTSAERLQIKEN